jgi:hypothetical protein
VESISELDNLSVFLAPAPNALEEQARRIRLDLGHRGMLVLSGGSEPWPESRPIIDLQLKQSLLSVHLLGSSVSSAEDAGAPFNGTRAGGPFNGTRIHSTEVLGSLDAALDFSLVNPLFPIFVWCGPDGSHSGFQDQHLALLDREVGPNTEIVQSSLEDFKSLVYDRIESGSAQRSSAVTRMPKWDQAPFEGGPVAKPELYVIYDQQDKEAAKPITDFIQGKGVTVLESVFEGEQSTLRSIHNEYLRRCDAALIIYGRVREPWVRMKQQDLLRSPALGRRKNLSAKGVLLCSLMTDMKMRFTAPDMMVIKEAGSMGSGVDNRSSTLQSNLAGLAPFLQKLSAI